MRTLLSSSCAALAVVVLAAAPLPALAQARTLGTFTDWTAYVDTSGGRTLCYMGTTPKKSEGDYTRRGDVFLFVSHRPADKVTGEVSIETGYPFKEGSVVTAEIDRKNTFRMFTSGQTAWNYDSKADQAMVAAMRAGSQMIVKGTSQRGTLTTDTYSLSGFTAAYNAISRACNVR